MEPYREIRRTYVLVNKEEFYVAKYGGLATVLRDAEQFSTIEEARSYKSTRIGYSDFRVSPVTRVIQH